MQTRCHCLQGLCREVTHLRTELAERISLQHRDDTLIDWLVETFTISITNASASACSTVGIS